VIKLSKKISMLEDHEIAKRIEKCMEGNLCFITLEPLDDGYYLVEHEVSFVKVSLQTQFPAGVFPLRASYKYEMVEEFSV